MHEGKNAERLISDMEPVNMNEHTSAPASVSLRHPCIRACLHFCIPALLVLLTLRTVSAQPNALTADQQLARDLFRQLVEINTSYKGGSTGPAAKAVAERFLAAGFPSGDVRIIGPQGDKDSSVIVRMPGSSSARPLLLLAHLDVVEALRSDWSMDPFAFIERDGYFYGRGTSDIKDGAATLIAALLRLKREVTPARTLILALTAGEEGGGGYNGVSWLLANHRDLIDAELCLNVDGGDPFIKNGKRVLRSVQSSEKLFLSFRFEVTNPGGHSSLPPKDNAIYHLTAGLDRLAAYQFPVHLNETTRAYFGRYAALESGQTAADMKAIAIDDKDAAAAARLSSSPFYNAQLRTTCVPTMLEAGHAENALPQTARAIVNCRIVPEETPDQTRATLARVMADPAITITPVQAPRPTDASKLSPAIMGPVERVTARLFPGVPVIPQMETGATDGAYLRGAGIPTYGVSGVFIDMDDNRAHGRDERILVQSFYDGAEFIYQLVRELAASR
jgi:acetylornithine deacetylase/succinyl-diaminopimelate desuccinylase-like protein